MMMMMMMMILMMKMRRMVLVIIGDVDGDAVQRHNSLVILFIIYIRCFSR